MWNYALVSNLWEHPPVDIHEDGKQWVIKKNLPGCRLEDIQVHYREGALNIAAHRETPYEGSGSDYKQLLRERSGDRFECSYEVRDVDPDAITAHYSQGVLMVTILKRASASARKIEVKIPEN